MQCTLTKPNVSKTELDYTFINTKWINSIFDCDGFSSFDGVSSDHRIVSTCVDAGKTLRYDWLSLINSDLSNQ